MSRRSALEALKGADEPAAALPDSLRQRPQLGLKRKRAWEERQRQDPKTTQVTFRGIPRDLRDQLNTVASELGITVSELARFFLEYGLASYVSGTVRVPIRLAEIKRTVDFGEE